MDPINCSYKNLTTEQIRFACLVSTYPYLEKFWDWDAKACDVKGLKKAMRVMSNGEQHFAKFILSLWRGANNGFDIIDATAVLDSRERDVIIDWLKNPFWP